MKIDGAILDIDGTILDSMPVWHNCGERFLNKMGIEAEPDLGFVLFTKTSITASEYLIDNYNLDMTVDEVRRHLNDDMAAFYRTEADFKPGALDFLKELRRRNIPSVVVSSTDQQFLETALHRLGVDDWIISILSSGSMATSKAEPYIWNCAVELLREHGADSDIYAFDDGLYAIRAAKAAGIKTVGIYDDISAADESAIRSIADLYLYNVNDFPFDE